MATGTRKRYNLVEGTLGAALGLGGSQVPFYDPAGLPGSLTNNASASATKGLRFTADQTNINVNGGRVYMRAGVPVRVRLYRVSDQVSLAVKDITSIIDTWVDAIFDTPVPLDQGADYLITLSVSGQSDSLYTDSDVTSDLTGGGGVYLSFVQGYHGALYDTYPTTALGNRVDGMIDVLTQQISPVTNINFGTDPGFATIGADEYIPLTIDNSEIVHLTDFTSGGTTGTVERTQEGTTAGDHASGASWVHGPTKQDFEVDELVGYDTLALASQLPEGGSLLTDAAADPVDGDGAIGDFHLRRDSGTLTGPKTINGTENLLDSSQQNSGDFAHRMAVRFTLDVDAYVQSIKFAAADVDANDPTFTFNLLDSSRNILATTESDQQTSGASYDIFNLAFADPVFLTAGEYYVAAMGPGTRVAFDLGNGTEFTGTNVSAPTGGAETLIWNTGGADFLGAPDETFASVYFWAGLDIATGTTWTGSDSLLLASRLLAVEDVGTATYSVVTDDTGKVKRCTVDCTVSLPDSLPIGTVVEVMAFSSGGVTVQAGGTATVHGGGTVAQYGTCSALCVATDTWVVTGAA